MIGSELKEIRTYYKLNQFKFAKRLGVTQTDLSRMENDILEITPDIVQILVRNQRREYKIVETDKIFSRDLFLKDMLTGNKVIDDIYINADWLYKLDGKKVYIKRTKFILLNDKNEEIEVLKGMKQYIIKYNQTFYPKKEWITSIGL